METNNLSKEQKEDINETTHEEKNPSDQHRMKDSDRNTGTGSSGDYRSSHGTGMSAEARSEQSEKSWQDTGGSGDNESK